MDSVRATIPFVKHPTDAGSGGTTYAFIFEDAINLPAGLTISSVGAITVAVESGTDSTTLVVGSGTANAASFEDDDGNTVPIGKAVLADMSAGTNGVNDLVTIPVTLSSGRVVAGVFPVWVRQ